MTEGGPRRARPFSLHGWEVVTTVPVARGPAGDFPAGIGVVEAESSPTEPCSAASACSPKTDRACFPGRRTHTLPPQQSQRLRPSLASDGIRRNPLLAASSQDAWGKVVRVGRRPLRAACRVPALRPGSACRAIPQSQQPPTQAPSERRGSFPVCCTASGFPLSLTSVACYPA